jgi:hypothetical protein
MKGVTLTNDSADKRRELDFYPTPPEVTIALMRHLDYLPKMKIWEPACGAGSMSEVIKTFGHKVKSSDLGVTGYGVGGIDFLQTTLECDAIITNPPFNLSEQFILHALGQADIVAMVLKSQYWHAAKRLKLFTQHPPAWVLPLTWRPDFLFDQRQPGDKVNPTMEVGWTVWIKGDESAKYLPLTKPKIA